MAIYCDCPCHEPGSTIMHFAACCSICPKCGKGISVGFRGHFESCKGELLDKMKRKKKRQYLASLGQ